MPEKSPKTTNNKLERYYNSPHKTLPQFHKTDIAVIPFLSFYIFCHFLSFSTHLLYCLLNPWAETPNFQASPVFHNI